MTTRQAQIQAQSPARTLREKMASAGLVRIMATHSPLSARLAEEAGFDGLWASGFELSALYGLADVSLISMTQHLDMVRAIAEQSRLPLVADLDTGFGNAINVIHAVEQYQRAGAAAVVIEDKTFPKVTSLAADARQELVRIAEFQGKIEAAVAARRDPDFLIVARTEALIAGLGEAEALKRAAAYAEAGADMILVHSKQKNAGRDRELRQSLDRHAADRDRADRLSAAQRSAHSRARQDRHGDLRQSRHPRRGHRDAGRFRPDHRRRWHSRGRQEYIVPVDEIFRLQRMDQIKAAERKFLR